MPDPVPSVVLHLVQQFSRHRDAYQAGKYNETQLRRDYLDPLFKALGWDIDNEEGFAEAYRQVVHEDAIKIGGTTKAPDYAFRIGGQRKFFVEAKKPSVNLKDDPAPALQLRRYAWTAKLPLSILTDFGEFSIYDCRKPPKPTDKAHVARLDYFTFDQLESKWPELVDLFSPQAIQQGAFDKYATKKRTRGTADVDDVFLDQLETWRQDLAKHLIRQNPPPDGLTQRQLNHAVQLIIDRIVFLRICEDRGIEPAGQLLALTNGSKVYERLNQIFRAADAKYNSGLFHFEPEPGRDADPDTLTPSLAVGDKPLKDILKALYPPESPYEFSVLPADILGQLDAYALSMNETNLSTAASASVSVAVKVSPVARFRAEAIMSSSACTTLVLNPFKRMRERADAESGDTSTSRCDALSSARPTCSSCSIASSAFVRYTRSPCSRTYFSGIFGLLMSFWFSFHFTSHLLK